LVVEGPATLAVITLLVAIVMWVMPFDTTDTPSIIQPFGGKLAVLVVLFTATLWCARFHNALIHQSTVNRHRALSLQIFQAFSQAQVTTLRRMPY
jgi:hypothetical protein